MRDKQKRVWIVVILAMAVVLAWGCAQEKTAAPATLKMTILGGSSGGTWAMVTSGIAECVNKEYPGSVVTVTTGSGNPNIIRVSKKEAEAGMANSVSSTFALNGEEPFKEKQENVAAVASLYSNYYHIIASGSLGVSSLDDIISKKMKVRFSVDQQGTNTELLFRSILGEYGVTYADIEAWGGAVLFKNMTESASMLGDGLIDCFAIISLNPTPTIQELAVNSELRLLTVKPEVIRTIAERRNFSVGTIPAGTYAFSDQDVTTFASNAVLIIGKDVPEETGYQLAKALVNNLEYFRSISSALGGLTAEKMTQNTGFPLHAGAEKYYREAGILK